MSTRLLRRSLPAVGGAALAAMLIGAAAPAGAQPGPPGNNGTVKVDGVVFDDHPNDEPHPGCTFQIDFYGFDAGELFADVTFEAVAPTEQVVPLLVDTIAIGEDDNSGGGSEAGHDASVTYELTEALAAVAPHPEQGWHVELTVNADGSQGADTKHKVFWVSACATDQPPSTPPSTPPSSTPGSTVETPGSTTSTTVGITPGASTTILPGDGTPGGPSDPQGPGQPVDVEPTSSGGGLPVTGSNSVGLVALAVLLIGAGVGVVVVTRRARIGEG
jgi:hypothetical protein